jgi:hypothetical protein
MQSKSSGRRGPRVYMGWAGARHLCGCPKCLRPPIMTGHNPCPQPRRTSGINDNTDKSDIIVTYQGTRQVLCGNACLRRFLAVWLKRVLPMVTLVCPSLVVTRHVVTTMTSFCSCHNWCRYCAASNEFLGFWIEKVFAMPWPSYTAAEGRHSLDVIT